MIHDKYTNFTDKELIRTADNSNYTDPLVLAIIERLDMRMRDLQDTANELCDLRDKLKFDPKNF